MSAAAALFRHACSWTLSVASVQAEGLGVVALGLAHNFRSPRYWATKAWTCKHDRPVVVRCAHEYKAALHACRLKHPGTDGRAGTRASDANDGYT